MVGAGETWEAGWPAASFDRLSPGLGRLPSHESASWFWMLSEACGNHPNDCPAWFWDAWGARVQQL